MATIKNAITDLSGLKALAYEKAAKAESSRTDQQIQSSQIKAAEERIKQAESSVTRYELEKSKALDKLSPPPTKTVPGEGKKAGSKTVVDEREKDKLQAQVRASDLQLSTAQSAVDAAKSEASDMKNNILVSAGLTEQQGQSMANLQKQIDDLEKLANDDQTDLTGEDFQNKLKSAISNTEDLAKELPDNANAAIQDFWEDIGDGFNNIQNKITEQITPTPANVDSSNNYAGYFQDVEQGFDAILGNLEANGEGVEVLNSVRSSRNLILGNKQTYLGGMTEGDDEVLSGLLTHVNTMIDKMQDEDLTAEDVATLNVLSDDTNSLLRAGGSAFEDVIAIPFNTAAVNLDNIALEMEDNDKFVDMYMRYEGLFNGGNSYSQLQSITQEEVDELYELADISASVYQTMNEGGTVSDAQMDKLTSKGNAIADKLEGQYGFNTSLGDGALGTGGVRERSKSRRYTGVR